MIPMDIATAFDDLDHDVIFRSLLARGVHPALARALMLEYTDLRARVTLADAEPTDFFAFSSAGFQGVDIIESF